MLHPPLVPPTEGPATGPAAAAHHSRPPRGHHGSRAQEGWMSAAAPEAPCCWRGRRHRCLAAAAPFQTSSRLQKHQQANGDRAAAGRRAAVGGRGQPEAVARPEPEYWRQQAMVNRSGYSKATGSSTRGLVVGSLSRSASSFSARRRSLLTCAAPRRCDPRFSCCGLVCGGADARCALTANIPLCTLLTRLAAEN